MGESQLQTSGLIMLTPPASRPVTWAEARAHLRLDDDTQQTYVETLIDAAVDFAQDSMACSLMPQTLLATYYNGDPLILRRGPLIEVVSITDANDAEIAADGYELSHVGHEARVTITAGSFTYPLSVTYRTGYANAASVPAGIRIAILQHVATLFENRESVSDKSKMSVPHTLEAFYRLKARKAPVG